MIYLSRCYIIVILCNRRFLENSSTYLTLKILSRKYRNPIYNGKYMSRSTFQNIFQALSEQNIKFVLTIPIKKKQLEKSHHEYIHQQIN